MSTITDLKRVGTSLNDDRKNCLLPIACYHTLHTLYKQVQQEEKEAPHTGNQTAEPVTWKNDLSPMIFPSLSSWSCILPKTRLAFQTVKPG